MSRAVLSILVWDSPEYVDNLLTSLFATHPVSSRHDWSVVLLDQGSTEPATASALARHESSPALTVHRVPKNIGFPKGHNLLYEKAKSAGPLDFFCPVNSDVLFEEDNWLDRLLDPLLQHADAAISGPSGVSIRTDRGKRYGHGRMCSTEQMAAGEYAYISGSICAIRAGVIEELGLFDEVFTPGYFEDADLNFRFQKAGYRLLYAPVKHQHHYRGREASTTRTKKEELLKEFGAFQERNRQVFLKRWESYLGLKPDPAWWQRLFPW